MSKFIRPKELETQFGIDRVTAWRWGRDPKKQFPRAVRLSANISFYNSDAIRAWFDAQEAAANNNEAGDA